MITSSDIQIYDGGDKMYERNVNIRRGTRSIANATPSMKTPDKYPSNNKTRNKLLMSLERESNQSAFRTTFNRSNMSTLTKNHPITT